MLSDWDKGTLQGINNRLFKIVLQNINEDIILQKYQFNFLEISIYKMGNGQQNRGSYLAKTDKTKSGRIYKITSDRPFAQGCNRLAFKAEIMEGPYKGYKGVVKVFKDRLLRNSTREILADIRVQQIAKEYAVPFSEKLGDKNILKIRESQLTTIQKVYQQSDFFTVGKQVAVERFIESHFQKWTDHEGNELKMSRTLNAYEHYVFVKSQGMLMICDLQGAGQNGHYILTDPTMSSTTGEGDRWMQGPQTIQRVMGRHRCNQICQKLGLW